MPASPAPVLTPRLGRGAVAALVALTLLLPASLRAQGDPAAPPEGWTALFNGRDLEGWTPKISGLPPGADPLGTFRVEVSSEGSYHRW